MTEIQMQKTNLNVVLAKFYPAYQGNLLRWGSEGEKREIGPALIFPAPMTQTNRPESVLAGLDLNVAPLEDMQRGERNRLFNILIDQGKKVFDQPTYTMLKLELNTQNEEIKMQCSMGTYFDALGSCVALSDEFFKRESPAASLNELPLRKIAHRFGDPILDGRGRSAAIGIATLLVFKGEDGKYGFVVGFL